MRILRLRFRNLNSLAGEWEIDFTHPAYVSSGIFAITGPTGAGKSTILDGICLALYGQTPRLSRITQSENEIMSRQTGDCAAEVEFETGKGRFRCHWSQHRSRKQADGQLQAPRHEIADAAGGTILEAKLKAVAAKVEEVTGMDFDRFTRSMLLAQGGFAAFLQATPDKRAPILEQITGTGIYSRISEKVHELTMRQRRSLEAMRADLKGLELLSPEQEAGLRHELATKELEEADLGAVLLALREQKSWRERLTALEDECAQADDAWRSFVVRQETALPELEQLAKGNRALSVEGDYVKLEGMRNHREAEQAELTIANERLPMLRRACRDAATLLETAEHSLQSSRTEQAREAEFIRTARELDLKIDAARAGIQALEKETDKLRKQRDEYRVAGARCATQLNTTETALRAIEAFLDDHRADAGLAEALTGMAHQVKALKALEGQAADRLQQLERQATACTQSKQAREQAERAWREASTKVAEAEKRLGTVRERIVTLLRGRELSAWRTEAEALVTRLHQLQTLHESVTRRSAAALKVVTLSQQRETLVMTRRELARKEETLADDHRLRHAMLHQLQEKVVLLNRVRDLEAERAKLLDGAPCPLCGATEHPYAVGNVPSLDAARRELENAGVAAREIGEQLSAVRADQAGVVKEMEQVERERRDYQEGVERDTALSATLVAELELGPSAPEPDAIRSEQIACQETLAGCRAVISEIEQGEQEERKAQGAYDRARDLLAGKDTAHQTAALGLANAEAEQGRLESDYAALRDELDRALAEVERAMEPYGCREISLQNAAETLAGLTKRRAAHGERLREQERLNQKRAELDGELRKQQALLAEADRNCTEREGVLRGTLSQRDELAAARRELFGERDPDREEQRLTATLKEAAERRDTAWREQNTLQAELAGLEESIRAKTATVAERTADLAELEPVFFRRLIEVGFADEAALLRARLPKARFAELTRLDESLRREETELRTRRRDRAEALLIEQEKRLTDKGFEQLLEEQTSAEARLNDLRKELGAVEQQLLTQSERLRLRQTRLEAVEQQKKEYARWEWLHELIGSADGKKFRNFAQGLTFEVMVSHANRQLRKMSDRYILLRDRDEPLDLNVIDNYQAGEIRSTKNLSGGESFIVSLALSLGLSSMASRTVRVDSLFLDEGFGTLDEDALETALETLSGLQQDGKLIGIISHVPALKERIGTQIQVEAGNAGRGGLSGPGCSRVGQRAN